MLRIAICDDISEELQKLVSLINHYISENRLDAEVTEFAHPDTLQTAIEAESFHLFILDIVMPIVIGLVLG